MPVSKRPAPDSRDQLYAMLRILLKEARSNYAIWGHMLQGPPHVERLTRTDLEGMVRIVERYIERK